jgi:hypothetical protein
VNRRFSALALSAILAGLVVTANLRESPAPEPVDVAAVDSYLSQLSRTAPAPPGAAIEKVDPASVEVSPTATKLDRAEPMVSSALTSVR